MRFAQYNAATRAKPACLDPWALSDPKTSPFTIGEARRLCALMVRVQRGDVGEWDDDMPTMDLAVMVGEIGAAEADALTPRQPSPAPESSPDSRPKWNHLAADSLAESIYSMAKIIWPERTPILYRVQFGAHLQVRLERGGDVLAYAAGYTVDEVDLVRQIHRQVFSIGKAMLEERNAK